jgi:hypothetical protein
MLKAKRTSASAPVGSCHRLRERPRVEHVALDERKAELALGVGQEFDLSGGEVVVTDNRLAA